MICIKVTKVCVKFLADLAVVHKMAAVGGRFKTNDHAMSGTQAKLSRNNFHVSAHERYFSFSKHLLYFCRRKEKAVILCVRKRKTFYCSALLLPRDQATKPEI